MAILKFKSWFKYLPLLALIIFLSSTNPHRLSLPLLLVPVVLLLLSLYLLSLAFLSKVRASRGQLTNKTVAVLVSFIVTVLVVMQSVSQLTSGDAILFLLIAIVMAIYLYKSGA